MHAPLQIPASSEDFQRVHVPRVRAVKPDSLQLVRSTRIGLRLKRLLSLGAHR